LVVTIRQLLILKEGKSARFVIIGRRGIRGKMTNKKIKPEKKPEQDLCNQVQVGEITLQSLGLPLEELIKYLIGMLEHKTIKDYLEGLSQRKLINLSKSYMS